MRPVGGGIHEAIVLDGHKGKTVTNSNDPPKSFHTSDLFVPHPVLPDRWKFVGRLDDRITLLNGEIVLPLPIEGRIRQHALVKEAVMFGIERPVPGLLLFCSKNAEHLNNEEFLNEVWPVLQEANSGSEGFSQISKKMVVVIGDDVDCPSTDKSSIKRARVSTQTHPGKLSNSIKIYREFATLIDESYAKLESTANGVSLQPSIEELRAWMIEQLQALDVNIPDSEADLFSSGVDSLKAIQRLAEKLYRMRIGEHVTDNNKGEIEEMKALIEKYSKFETVSDRRPSFRQLYDESVIVSS
jgi:acyl-CoA synthetase (AMP-forming)/AMP-acid ligase II